jgi:hypothetical protein
MLLYDFAWCKDFDKKLTSLAAMTQEAWSIGPNNDCLILKNYIEYTFQKVYDEGKVFEEPYYSVFNTGLYNSYYEPLFAYFTQNRVPDRQAWVLENFCTSYQLAALGITVVPPRANYFDDPAALVFDTNCEIIPQYDHIFGKAENFARIPPSVQDSANRILLFDGAIQRAKAMINADYKVAIPQYYKGRVQLLLPMFLSSPYTPDLALVVSRGETAYMGHTCLTLEMAYANARLIARLEGTWLQEK